LFFAGNLGLNSTNDYVAGTLFAGLTFLSPAGPFNLWGNRVTLGGGITNLQTLVTQTVSLPLTLGALTPVWVVDQGSLTLTGPLDGAHGGILKLGGGLLTLAGANTLGGPVVIREGLVSISSDGHLGVQPPGFRPDALVLD
jgi:autotransporter-associated beta strand protein